MNLLQQILNKISTLIDTVNAIKTNAVKKDFETGKLFKKFGLNNRMIYLHNVIPKSQMLLIFLSYYKNRIYEIFAINGVFV